MTDSLPHITNFSNLAPPNLAAHEVHVMAASLDELAHYRERVVATVNQEERERAARFVNPAHGEHFALVRGSLRCCLERYLDIPADKIAFDFNKFGKPEIRAGQNAIALRFNVSHSHQMAAFVFMLHQPVGIDIEYMKPLKNLDGLAQHVCSPQEWDEFGHLDVTQNQTAFFRLWTRKEAFIKANGQGLSMGLRSIYIGMNKVDYISRVKYENRWLENWFIKDLLCPPDYKMAIALERPPTLF